MHSSHEEMLVSSEFGFHGSAARLCGELGGCFVDLD